MKRVLAVLLMLLALTGCGNNVSELNRAIALREALLKSEGCTFVTVITADYGEKVYSFRMQCQADKSGNITFEVTDPDTISGITGTVSEEAGKLTFDDEALMFQLLADGQVTPVSAPWLLLHTLRSGYISACGNDGNGLHIQIDDSYADDALQIDIWTDENDIPIRAEVLWQSRRVVSMDVENFTIL